MEYFILWVVIGAIGGAIIGHFKGRIGEGAAFGAFLGFIGWLLLLLSPDSRKKCPACKGPIPEDATKCMHCGTDLLNTKPTAKQFVNPDDLEVEARSKYVWVCEVECPACGMINEANDDQKRTGLRCKRCHVGWVPASGLWVQRVQRVKAGVEQ